MTGSKCGNHFLLPDAHGGIFKTAKRKRIYFLENNNDDDLSIKKLLCFSAENWVVKREENSKAQWLCHDHAFFVKSLQMGRWSLHRKKKRKWWAEEHHCFFIIFYSFATIFSGKEGGLNIPGKKSWLTYSWIVFGDVSKFVFSLADYWLFDFVTKC